MPLVNKVNIATTCESIAYLESGQNTSFVRYIVRVHIGHSMGIPGFLYSCSSSKRTC